MPPFGLPDKGVGVDNVQSMMFNTYWDLMQAGIRALDCVLNGGLVSAQGTPDMTVAVAKAGTLTNGVLKATAAGNGTITAADATNPRLDLVVINSAGAIAVRAGTPAANPKPPARTANDVVLASVFVPANDTAVNANQITDLRMIRDQGPLTIYKTTAAETTNNTAAAIHALNKAGSGVTIPNGLHTSGRQLRVKLGGNMLINSGTPTVTIAITYGGTTMFSDVSAALTASATRRGFDMEFIINSQANADQALTGRLDTGAIAGITAPTTGIGDIWAHTHTAGSFSGSSAQDADTADRVVTVQVTFSVANAANELVVESASVELL